MADRTGQLAELRRGAAPSSGRDGGGATSPGGLRRPSCAFKALSTTPTAASASSFSANEVACSSSHCRSSDATGRARCRARPVSCRWSPGLRRASSLAKSDQARSTSFLQRSAGEGGSRRACFLIVGPPGRREARSTGIRSLSRSWPFGS